jgi:cobalt/nickel transport system permease protein
MCTRRLAAGTRGRARAIAGLAASALILGWGSPAWAMHISEGILPPSWAGLWFVVAAPFLWLGLREVRRRSGASPHFKVLTGLVGAAVFVISCMPVPVPFTGTCSHPCGTGLAAVIVGPAVTTVIAAIALLLQALFLAHGGLTTLGANIVSMGVVGAYAGWLVYAGMRRIGFGIIVAAGAAGLVSDWATYAATSGELAAALHGGTSFVAMFSAIALAFMPTQLPLGVLEAIVSGAAVKFLMARRPEFLAQPHVGGAGW